MATREYLGTIFEELYDLIESHKADSCSFDNDTRTLSLTANGQVIATCIIPNVPQIFIAQYGTTSYADILTAYQANKEILITTTYVESPVIGRVVVAPTAIDNIFYFNATLPNIEISMSVDSSNNWTTTYRRPQEKMSAGNAIEIDNGNNINVKFDSDTITLNDANELTLVNDYSAGDGIDISDDSVISAKVDNSSVRIDQSGNIYSADELYRNKINGMMGAIMRRPERGKFVQQISVNARARGVLDDKTSGTSLYAYGANTSPDDAPLSFTNTDAETHGVPGYETTVGGTSTGGLKHQFYVPNGKSKSSDSGADEFPWDVGRFVFKRQMFPKMYSADVQWEDWHCMNGIRKKDCPWYDDYEPIKIVDNPTAVSGVPYLSRYTVKVKALGENVKYQWQYSINGGKTWGDSTAYQYNHPQFSVPITKNAAPYILNPNVYYMRRCKLTCDDPNYGPIYAPDENGVRIQGEVANITVSKAYKNNDTAIVYCVAGISQGYVDDSHPLLYQWQQRRDDGDWGDIADATKTTLAQALTDPYATKVRLRVQCQMFDEPVYSYSDELTILELDTFTFTEQPVDVTVDLGDTATFKIAVGNGSGEFEYQWYYSSNGTSFSKCTLAGNTTTTYSFEGTNERNGNLYKCWVKDTVTGEIKYSDPAALTVIDTSGITITQQPQDTTVAVGETASFTVAATGYGLTYQWQLSLDSGVSWKDSAASGCKTTTVSVKGTAARNGYQYRCLITNASSDTVVSDAATLTVS